MEGNYAHKKFEESFGIEPGRLLQVLSEQKSLLLNEFIRLHKLGIIDDLTKETLFKKGSEISVKYFPEQFQEGYFGESQSTDS